jgi:hypothetical protein
MSGAYTRKLYDHCDMEEQDRISKGNGNYNLSKDPKLHKARLRPNGIMQSRDSIFNPHRKIHIGAMVDLESHLRNIDDNENNNDRCGDKTIKEKNRIAGKIYNDDVKQKFGKAEQRLAPSYSRMERPAQDVRSMTINRFDFPVTDPRAEIFYGFEGTQQVGDMRFGMDTRLDARDMDPNEYLAKIDDYKCNH